MLDNHLLQQELEALGLLTPGSYHKGEMDLSTRKSVNLIMSITGKNSIEDALEDYRSRSIIATSTSDTPKYTPINPTNKYKELTQGNKSNKPLQFDTSKIGSRKSRSHLVYDKIDCYIVNLRTQEIINFSLESPEDISESLGNSFASTNIRGRSHPHYSYESSEGRSISFKISLHDDYCDGGVKNVVSKCRKLALPAVDNGQIVSPEVLVKIGNVINIPRGVIKSVSVDWTKPYRDGIYLTATVSFEVDEVVNENYTQSNVKEW